ncbi:hypothetical protein KVR01_000381 [Diaporthe batatas]|uniref:uncharacterized protein n=1 Tax=Diaporthe batatas TaxID=748121 RepID=UPI001D050878|nr:uncharacterized protein KVR01_000381 [Diaporthe batatas]KAG8169636.1 hypothetical protein KVR01_000381 [Diaporthe batatas]
MHSSILILPAAASLVSAGSAVLYMCTLADDPRIHSGSTAMISLRAHYNNAEDGCDGLFAFDASTGAIPPLLGYHRFKGDDGFAADMELLSPRPGLHIRLDDEEVALGDASETTRVGPEDSAEACRSMGLEDTTGGRPVELIVFVWYDVPKTKCK